MKLLLPTMVMASLSLTACDGTDYKAQQKSIDASSASTLCYLGMNNAQKASREGKPRPEIMKHLSDCHKMSEAAFIEKALEQFERVAALKDPSSVQYQGLRKSYPHKVDGKYNAKNSYGAYTGFKSFTVGISDETGKWYVKTSNY